MADRLDGPVGEEAAAQVHVHADQGDQGHDQAYVDDVNPHVPVDDPVADGSGRAVHQIVGLRIHAHGQRGRRVGQEVDPEQLGGQQRHGHARHAGLRYAQKTSEDHAAEDREDLAHVGAEQVAQELANVVEDAAALSHSLDDGGEIVVRQDHLGRFLGDLGPGDAHGHADVCGLDSRGIVDAVAGHGHDLALVLERFDDLQLVLGGHAGVDGDLGGGLPKLVRVHGIQLLASAGRLSGLDDAQVPCDSGCSKRMVAGDHDRSDAGLVSLIHRMADLSAGRVNDADHARPDQIALQSGAFLDHLVGRQANCRSMLRLFRQPVRLIRPDRA